METMWAGRFKKQISEMTNDFNASIKVDGRMFEEDIRGSMAHAAMLGAQGIIPKEEADKLIGVHVETEYLVHGVYQSGYKCCSERWIVGRCALPLECHVKACERKLC